ncbi:MULTISPECIES: helix-turn-helix transcriptional regulator [unclassified Ruegeria]|uniref:helix-turn-helix domain-containing protein n=1 Tax=unclassified Ruegeria TaxID=2625375 RepID=UPI001ADC1D11|nr:MULTISPECIES: helix-turn-helix transcriptional regulator [unclassified Ruegeria]MBO9411927.1 helix-turn-helix domain-containing protein [Ruegeria sp. R8_1]MBO9417036.1 helix-turn-helix domain-containing protein [Ruegeria sp. R8_2]
MLDDLSNRLANRLNELRLMRGWSLDQLAERSSVSRATLSRLEKGGVSPTAETLGRLCAAYGLPMSRLLMMVEDSFAPRVPLERQPEWRDPETGFTRRSVSPPATGLSGEVMEGHLPTSTVITYDAPPKPGQEHHLIMLDGALTLTVDGAAHDLTAGDCLRYHLSGSTRFETSSKRGARYLLVLI